MVAQQVLVLFVLVRIRVRQLEKRLSEVSFLSFRYFWNIFSNNALQILVVGFIGLKFNLFETFVNDSGLFFTFNGPKVNFYGT